MTDYTELLDDEIWAFIEKTNAAYPPDAVDLTIQEQRTVYDRMCAEFRVGYPEGVKAEDVIVERNDFPALHSENVPTSTPLPQPLPPQGGQGLKTFAHAYFADVSGREASVLPTRTYRLAGSTPNAQILYFHGGGFVVGGLDSHDDACAELCAGTGLPLTAVDYRLAPEYTHPAAFDDALMAYRHLIAHSELPVILAGDSAGATLAAAVAHATRDDAVKPVGQVLLYPALGGDKRKGSYVEHADAPMLTTKDMQFYHNIVSGGLDTGNDIRLNPLADTDFSGLPKTTIITAQCDPLADDGRDYRDRILAAGGEAEWFNEQGLVHGFLRARHCSKRAGDSFRRVIDTILLIRAAGR